jgi:hypothetical protein
VISHLDIRAAQGHRGAADEAHGARNEARCYRHRAARARTFECMVCHCQVRQFDASPGDHFEGQFEGQNGASGCLSKPVAACVG